MDCRHSRVVAQTRRISPGSGLNVGTATPCARPERATWSEPSPPAPDATSSPSLVEGQAEARELWRDRHGCFEVEDLDDLRVLADQLARPRRQLLLRRLDRLPDVERAPALGRLVAEPRLEEQALDLL